MEVWQGWSAGWFPRGCGPGVPRAGEPVIRARQLAKRYGDRRDPLVILDEVAFGIAVARPQNLVEIRQRERARADLRLDAPLRRHAFTGSSATTSAADLSGRNPKYAG